MCYTRYMIKIATWPTRKALSITADLLFGKPDETPYVSLTSVPRGR